MNQVDLLSKAIETLETQLETVQSSVAPLQPDLQQSFGAIAKSLTRIKSAGEDLSRSNPELAGSSSEHRRYRELFEFSPDGYIVTDRRGTIQEANLIAAQMLKVPAAYLVGKPIVLFLGNEGARFLLDQVHANRHHQTKVTAWENKVRPRFGESFYAMIRSSIIYDERGKQAGIRLLIRDVTDAKRKEVELQASHEQLRALAARLQEIREEERNHLARELHDEFGAALTTLKLDLTWLKKHLPKDAGPIQDRLAAMSKLIEVTTQGIRETATMLRPRLLDDFGLVAAIEWQVQEFEKRSGIACDLTTEEVDLPLDCATSVFRILQECLTNIARHAGAASVEISLQKENGSVVMCIHDDGRGFDLESSPRGKSLGLVGMRERAYAFGGDFAMESAPGRGTQVTIRIPCSTDVKERRVSNRNEPQQNGSSSGQ